MSTSSVCNVFNIINEQFRGYIEPEDLYILLRHLFPNVARREDFQLDVRLFSRYLTTIRVRQLIP